MVSVEYPEACATGCSLVPGVDLGGGYMIGGCGNSYQTAQGCCDHCQRVEDCVAFTWLDFNHTTCPGSCYIKSSFNVRAFARRAIAVSGFKGPPPTIPTNLTVVAATITATTYALVAWCQGHLSNALHAS